MESRLLEEFEVLWQVISEEANGRDVYYMPNPGNWGDGLIKDGTHLFFKDKNLKFKTLLPKKRKWYYLKKLLTINPFKPRILIYGGGGGWTKMWGYPYRLLKQKSFTFFFSKIIVLPSTYEIYLESDKVIYFSRDQFESQKINPSSKFCHDMAFYLMTLNQIELVEPKEDKIEKGYFFRTDKESKNAFSLPPDNFDISLQSNYEKSFKGFLSILNRYDEIYTDRLHVAIVSCLLNKKLHFWEGSYFKNEAVFKSSISLFEEKHFETGNLVY